MRTTTTYGHIESGKLKIHYKEKFKESISQFSDGRVEVKVRRLYNKRSHPQNDYYWGCLIQEFIDGYKDTTGESITKNQAHEILKGQFNSKEIINQKSGEVIRVPQSTSNLTTTEFMDYIEECIRFIAEWFGRTVADPGEQTQLNYE